MRQQLLILIVFITSLAACSGQTTDKKAVEKKVTDAVNKWMENPSLDNDTFDLKILDQLKDSGQYVNNVKEGLWKEYSIDSSMVGLKYDVVIGSKTLTHDYGIILEKFVGAYTRGKREGVWTGYKSFSKHPPVDWEIKSFTEYSNGLKNGTEAYYQMYFENQKVPLLERHFTSGVETGIGKVYNKNAPYNLQQIYVAKNGKSLLMKEYFDDGKPRYLFSDTLLKGEHLRYFQSFSESSYLTQTAFYANDTIAQGEMKEYYTNGNVKSSTNFQNGVPDGVYKYFYDNGQLWTERLYSKGKVMEVISNFNHEGKPVDKGTLKAGTGTVIVYDEEGKQTSVLTYKNGELVR